jgi:hypothetical protein
MYSPAQIETPTTTVYVSVTTVKRGEIQNGTPATNVDYIRNSSEIKPELKTYERPDLVHMVLYYIYIYILLYIQPEEIF